MAKDTNIKFGVRAPRESLHMNPKRNVLKIPCGQGHVTLTFLGVKC